MYDNMVFEKEIVTDAELEKAILLVLKNERKPEVKIIFPELLFIHKQI